MNKYWPFHTRNEMKSHWTLQLCYVIVLCTMPSASMCTLLVIYGLEALLFSQFSAYTDNEQSWATATIVSQQRKPVLPKNVAWYLLPAYTFELDVIGKDGLPMNTIFFRWVTNFIVLKIMSLLGAHKKNKKRKKRKRGERERKKH